MFNKPILTQYSYQCRCPLIFKDHVNGCPYTGEADSCDKTLEKCTELNGTSQHFVYGRRRIATAIATELEAIEQHRQMMLSAFNSLPDRNQPHSINNTACYYYSENPYLRCAVNPTGSCEGCKDFVAVILNAPAPDSGTGDTTASTP